MANGTNGIKIIKTVMVEGDFGPTTNMSMARSMSRNRALNGAAEKACDATLAGPGGSQFVLVDGRLSEILDQNTFCNDSSCHTTLKASFECTYADPSAKPAKVVASGGAADKVGEDAKKMNSAPKEKPSELAGRIFRTVSDDVTKLPEAQRQKVIEHIKSLVRSGHTYEDAVAEVKSLIASMVPDKSGIVEEELNGIEREAEVVIPQR